MQISSTFNLVWEHSDQVFWISHNLASYSLAKVLILGGKFPPSVSVVEEKSGNGDTTLKPAFQQYKNITDEKIIIRDD